VNITKYFFILFTDPLDRTEWPNLVYQLIKCKIKWVVKEFAKKKKKGGILKMRTVVTALETACGVGGYYFNRFKLELSF
jgi:hypothetical protein